jgi:GxxExxY protein
MAREDPLTYRIIGCALAVHRELGPGLLESVYEECLARQLERGGLQFTRQPALGVSYNGNLLSRTFRPDFVIEREVVLEVKAVTRILPVHQAQALTYMKLAHKERGLIINFNVEFLTHGIKRLILSRNA